MPERLNKYALVLWTTFREFYAKGPKRKHPLPEARNIVQSNQVTIPNEFLKAAMENKHNPPKFVEIKGWQNLEEEKKAGE